MKDEEAGLSILDGMGYGWCGYCRGESGAVDGYRLRWAVSIAVDGCMVGKVLVRGKVYSWCVGGRLEVSA